MVRPWANPNPNPSPNPYPYPNPNRTLAMPCSLWLHLRRYGLGQTYEILAMPYYALFYYRKATALRPYDSRMWCAS